jgi:hypothetical protein
MGLMHEYLLAQYLRNDAEFPDGEWEAHSHLLGDVFVHKTTGVVMFAKPIVLYHRERKAPVEVLFHYTQEKYFDLICNDGSAVLKASTDMQTDCDFGDGCYACNKGPDEWRGEIKSILLNNYPRRGPWGGGEPGSEHERLASHCIPLIVPRSYIKALPVSNPNKAILGSVRESKTRAMPGYPDGFHFDWTKHNIYIIRNPFISQTGKVKTGFSALDYDSISTEGLRDGSYAAKDFWEVGCSAKKLREAGFPAKELCEAGYSAKEVCEAGYSAKELWEAGYSAKALCEAGYSAKEVYEAGYSAKALCEAGYSGYSAMAHCEAGYSEKEVCEAGE